MLDYSAFETLDAGGLLTVAWRASPLAKRKIRGGKPYHGNLVGMTIPRNCHRIPDLTYWINGKSGKYGNELTTPADPKSDSVTLNLLARVDSSPRSSGKSLTIDTQHFCDKHGPRQTFNGTGGRPCARPLRTNGGSAKLTKGISSSGYIAMLWDWKKTYSTPTERMDPKRDRKEKIHKTITDIPLSLSPIPLVGMLIPGGTVVWLLLKNFTEANKAHIRLSDENTEPGYVLNLPYFIDGPDLFVATCDEFLKDLPH